MLSKEVRKEVVMINKNKEEYFEIWFITNNDHRVIDDNFTKIWNKVGEKIKNEKSKRISTA